MVTQSDLSKKATLIYSKEAQKAVWVGAQNHMMFRVVGSGEVPHEPYYKDQWWFELVESEAILPSEGVNRLDLLRRAGINIKSVVIAHEAPKILSAPKPAVKEPQKPDTDILNSFLPILGTVVAAVGAILGLFVMLFVRAILIDPALIVVLEDGTWLEVMTWYE